MTPRKRTILWLDDEPYLMSSYADIIRQDPRFDLICERSVDDALVRISQQDFKPDLLLWDMILPPGQLGLDKTDNGLRTGEVFLGEFRRRFPDVPTILFTNVSKADVHQRYNSPECRSRAWRKRDLLPDELVVVINDMLQSAEPESEASQVHTQQEPR